MERHVYRIGLDGAHKQALTSTPGTHTASWSPSYEYFIETFSDEITPPRTMVRDSNGGLVSVIEDNPMPSLKEFPPVRTRFFAFTTSDGVQLRASMMTPLPFDSTKRHPVLVYTYGGPGSQIVRRAWGGASTLWYTMLTQKGYVVFMVDNRGTGGRGRDFKQIGYRNLGRWEVNDHIEAAQYLASLSCIDKERIGIWGWSYGGYTSTMVLLKASDYFKTAVAVAPVTNWRYYDDIYTERYLGLPSDNPEAYRTSAATEHAGLLRGNLLLLHGTSDDNVHFQNTANLVTALQKEKKQFRVMFYPNKNHGINGKSARLHVYTLITDFILGNL